MTFTANDCPSCHQLQRDLAAALLRAEQAEKAAAIWEQRCSQATALSGQHLGELAVALRENERLRARLESAEAALRKAIGACEMQYAAANHMRGCNVCRVAPSPCRTGAELFLRAADANLAVLGAAGEEQEPAGG